MARKRVTYRPNKAAGTVGLIFGCIFVLIGIFAVIPMAGPFGILWTLAAIAITAGNAYTTFGKKYVGPEIHIEEEDEVPRSASVEERLTELRNLYDRSLITEEEYEAKKQDILKDL